MNPTSSHICWRAWTILISSGTGMVSRLRTGVPCWALYALTSALAFDGLYVG